jgi:hypothetical protein
MTVQQAEVAGGADHRPVTSQQQYSGREVARTVIEMLGV